MVNEKTCWKCTKSNNFDKIQTLKNLDKIIYNILIISIRINNLVPSKRMFQLKICYNSKLLNFGQFWRACMNQWMTVLLYWDIRRNKISFLSRNKENNDLYNNNWILIRWGIEICDPSPFMRGSRFCWMRKICYFKWIHRINFIYWSMWSNWLNHESWKNQSINVETKKKLIVLFYREWVKTANQYK